MCAWGAHGWGSIPRSPTESESAKLSLDWLCAEGVAQSSAKPFLYETASCRLVKKKFEPTVFPKNANSSDVFFARAIFAHDSALPIHSLKGSSQLEPFC